MIKAKGVWNGREALILGLSQLNLDQLAKDMPIVVHKEEIGIPFDIIVFSEKTEEMMTNTIKQYLTADAVITGGYRPTRRH